MAQEHRFDHLVVLMLENRSFDNLFGYLYEHDQPKHFIAAADHTFRGVAGRDDLCERWDLEGLTNRDRAAPSFASVVSRSEARVGTPDITPRPYERLPEPKAHESPLSHLGHQAVELSSAVMGEVAPVFKTAGDAVKHLFRHSKSR